MLLSGEEHRMFQTLRMRDEPVAVGVLHSFGGSSGVSTWRKCDVCLVEAKADTPCAPHLDGGGLAVKTVCRFVSGRLSKGSSSQIAQPIKPEYIGQSSNTLVPHG